MRIGLWFASVLLLASCYRDDPTYCDDKIPCKSDNDRCEPLLKLCVPKGAVLDMAGVPPTEDMAMTGGMDMSMLPDMTQPGCARNFECPGSACGADGKCVDKSKVLVVDENSARCDMDGGSGKPYCYLFDALKDSRIGKTIDVILLKPSAKPMGHYKNGDFLVIKDAVRVVGERANRSSSPVRINEPFKLQANGSKDIDVALEDVEILATMTGNVDGVRCERLPIEREVRMALRWSRISQAPLSGLFVDKCNRLEVRSAEIIGNASKATTAAVFLNGGDIEIVNSVIAGNGNDDTIYGGGLAVFSPIDFMLTRAKIQFNTIVDNRCGTGGGVTGCNIYCQAPTEFLYGIVTTPPSTANSRQGISGACTIVKSVVPTAYAGGSEPIKQAGMMPKFVDAAGKNYHLSTDAVNAPLRLSDANPPVKYDLDDDLRPSGDGKIDVGADQRN